MSKIIPPPPADDNEVTAKKVIPPPPSDDFSPKPTTSSQGAENGVPSFLAPQQGSVSQSTSSSGNSLSDYNLMPTQEKPKPQQPKIDILQKVVDQNKPVNPNSKEYWDKMQEDLKKSNVEVNREQLQKNALEEKKIERERVKLYTDGLNRNFGKGTEFDAKVTELNTLADSLNKNQYQSPEEFNQALARAKQIEEEIKPQVKERDLLLRNLQRAELKVGLTSKSIQRLAPDNAKGFFDVFAEAAKNNLKDTEFGLDLTGSTPQEKVTMLEDYYQLNKDNKSAQRDLFSKEGVAELFGGVTPTIAAGAVDPVLAATQASYQQYGGDAKKVYMSARNAGYSEVEALELVDKVKYLSLATGAAEGYIGGAAQSGIGGLLEKKIANKATQAVVAGLVVDPIIDASVATTLQATRNLNEQRIGLPTETSEGLKENASAEFAMSFVANALGLKGKIKSEYANVVKEVSDKIVEGKDNPEQLEKLMQNIDIMEAQKVVPKEYTDALRQKALDYTEALKKVPETLQEDLGKEDTSKLVVLVDQKDQLQKQIENSDEELSKPLVNQVTDINNEINAIVEGKVGEPIKYTSGTNDKFGYVEENGVKRDLTKAEFENYGNRVVEQQVESTSAENGGGVDAVAEEKVQGGEEGVQEVGALKDVESTTKALEDLGDLIENKEHKTGKKEIVKGNGYEFTHEEEKYIEKIPNILYRGGAGEEGFYTTNLDEAEGYARGDFGKGVLQKVIVKPSAKVLRLVDGDYNDYTINEEGEKEFERITGKKVDSGIGITSQLWGNTKEAKALKKAGYDVVYGWQMDGHTAVVLNKDAVAKATPKSISEAYHKAKADGSNPELVKAVEDLLTPTEKSSTTEIAEPQSEPIKSNEQSPLLTEQPKIENKTKKKEFKITPLQERKNELINLVEQYNGLNKNDKKKANDTLLAITARAKELGLEYKNNKGNVFILNKNGNRVRKVSGGNKLAVENHIPLESREAKTQELFNVINNKGVNSMPTMFDANGRKLSTAQVKSAMEDVANGHNSEGAEVLLNTLDKSINDGFVYLKNNEMETSVPINEYLEFMAKDTPEQNYFNEDYVFSQEEIEADAKEYDEWFNSLSEEEQNNELKYIQNENIDNRTESQENAGNQERENIERVGREGKEKIAEAKKIYEAKQKVYDKAKAKLDENGMQDQINMFGGAKAEEMLFKNDFKEQSEMVSKLKKEADDAKKVYDDLVTESEKDEVNPNQLELPSEPNLDNPKNQTELAETLVKKFKRNPILAQAEAKLFDLRADVWSRLTGNSKQDFYDRVSYGNEKSSDGLNQMTLPDGSTTMVKPINADVVNGFYSPLEKVINETKFDKLPAKQWIDKFAKGEEAKWTGLNKWLSQQQGSVSKADIQQYLKDNRIEVVEVVKQETKSTGFSDLYYELKDAYEADGYEVSLDENGYNIITPDGDTINSISDIPNELPKKERQGLVALIQEIEKSMLNSDNTKFSQYQLEGEKSNYREVLVTMPSKTVKEIPYKVVEERGGFQVYDSNGDRYGMLSKTRNEANEVVSMMSSNAKVKVEGGFKSSHFDEPNILVHLRMNTRTDAEGNKVLFLEEVQSDWGQTGKKEGFKGVFSLEKAKQRQKEISQEVREIDERRDVKKGSSEADLQRIDELNKEFDKINGEINKDKYVQPSAPFVTDTNAWTKLGLKVALKEAVKQGADKIAWTTGEQQNERYDLSKTIKNIDAKIDGTAASDNSPIYKITSKYKGGEETSGSYRQDELESVVGKELAEKIINNKGGKYEGVDLQVGGKGMKGFYGSPTEGSLGIVGNVAKSLFKQEPKTIEFESNNKSEVKVSTTEDIKKYSKEGYTFEEFYRPMTKQRAYEIIEGGGWVIAKKPIKSQQHSIDITPELKADVEKGQPLFQKEKGTAKGQINFTDKVKGFNNAVISLFNTAKADTFVHEFSHLNFQDMLSMAKDNEQIKADVRTAVEFYNSHAKPNQKIKDVDSAVERLMAIDAENHLRDDEYVKVHEAFANGFSEYLKDPNTTNIPQAIKEVYEAIKQFLGNIAQTIAGTKIKITPEMDAVYRRIFEPEFVNSIYETKENYDAEIEAKEFKESPIENITDDEINDAFNNLDNLFSEEKKSYTPNEIFNAKIAQLKKEGKTDGTIVVEQLKSLVDNSKASPENKAKLKEYIDLNADKYIAEAGEMERMRKPVRDMLRDNVMDLETKERLVADKTLATYIKTSMTQLGKTVDETIADMSYNDIIEKEALILEQIALNVPSTDIEYANLNFLSKKLKKGYAYLDMMKAEKGADKAKIKQLADTLYNELAESLKDATSAGKRLKAQQMFDVLRPNIMANAIDRMVREDLNGEKLAEAKGLIRVLQERIQKGLENEDIFKSIIEELEINFGDEKKRNELLVKRNLEMDKELSELESRIVKNDKEESETSVPARVRATQTKVGNKLKNVKEIYSNAKNEALAKIQVLNGLFSGEEKSPKELVTDYIFNYVAEQQALGGKVIRFNHMIKHFKDLGLEITNEGLAETYEQARQLAIAEGVSRKAMDTPQQVADALQNIEDKAQKARLKEEKAKTRNRSQEENSLDKILAEALKGGKWNERVTSVDREKSMQEVMNKVKENNPDIAPEDEAKIKTRLQELFKEKTDRWTEKELEKIQKKLNPKEKRQISGNFRKLADIINTNVFRKNDVSDLLLSELGLDGLSDDDKRQIEHHISAIQQLPHGDLKNKEIEQLSAYITAVTNPTTFITSLMQSKLYMEMLNSPVTSTVNATTLIGSLEKAITKSLTQLDPTYLKTFFESFNKGMVKSAVTKGYFKTNENYELAQTETGFAPVRMGEYTKYGKLLKTKGVAGGLQRGYASWVNFTNKLGAKRLARVNEGVDNLNTLINSNMAAYEYNKKLIKKENPNISKQELNNEIAKKLMPISYEDAYKKAIEQLAIVERTETNTNKDYKTSPSEINRIAWDIVNNSRDEATKLIMEQEGQRASFRNRLQPITNGGGLIEGLSAAVQGIFNNSVANVKNNPKMTNKDKARRIAGIKFAKAILTPFIQTPANLLEAGTHYAVVGGLIKEVSLQSKKRSLKNKQSQDATNRRLGYENAMAKAETQAEKDAITKRFDANEAKTGAIDQTEIYAINQYQKDVAIRMAKGFTLMFLMDAFFKSRQDDDDKEVKDGVYGDDPKNGKYRNSIVINGTRTPIMLSGVLAPTFSLYAAKSDYERYVNEKKVKEELTNEDEAHLTMLKETGKRFFNGTLKTTPYYGSTRVYESITGGFDDKFAGVGRIAGNALGYSLLPIPRPINDYSAFFYTDTKKPSNFGEGMMAVYNPLNPIITGKVDIDPITGQPVDVRDNRLVSVSGMVKNYLGDGSDEVASQLKNHNIVIVPLKKADFIKSEKEMTDDEFYLLQNEIYKDFSDKIKKNIDTKIAESKAKVERTYEDYDFTSKDTTEAQKKETEKKVSNLKKLEADKILNKEVQSMYKMAIDEVLSKKKDIFTNNTKNRNYLFDKQNLKK